MKRRYTGERGRDVVESLKESIPLPLLPYVPKKYEIIGDIAVITVPEVLLPYQKIIAESIQAQRRNISTVLRRVSKRYGEKRVAQYEPIIGSKTITEYRESGFLYRVDLAQTFFTTRLVGEHQRIAELIQPEETVFIPFAGVGPYVIPVRAKGAYVIALDINPVACQLLSENLRLNHLTDRTSIIRGDARTTDSLIKCLVDRAIIPTPYGLDETFIPVEAVVKSGGFIHYYTFKNKKQAKTLINTFQQSGYAVKRCHRCGNVAPSVSRWVYDLIKP